MPSSRATLQVTTGCSVHSGIHFCRSTSLSVLETLETDQEPFGPYLPLQLLRHGLAAPPYQVASQAEALVDSASTIHCIRLYCSAAL